MDATSRWQELIAENLAASSVPGYKKQDVSFSAIQAGLLPANKAEGPARFQFPQASSSINFQQGEMRYTGVNTDVAIEGPGFFEVQLSDGTTAYTRAGQLHTDSSGMLVNHQGYPVQGTGGPIMVDLNNPAPVTISRTGEVSQGLEVRGQLKAVEFNDRSLLTQIGGGYFLASNPRLRMTENAQTTFRSEFIETANTAATTEMANLMSAMRLYEANQKVVQAQDERIGKTIQEFASPS